MADERERPDAAIAMEEMISAYYEQIYRFCYWKTGDRVEAQDLTQDTFFRFLDSAQTYSDIENPGAFLYTIARNLCLNWHKRIRTISLEELDHCEPYAAEDFSEMSASKVALSGAVSALPEQLREILLLRYGQDLKVGEIAEILGLSRFQVMYRIRSALYQLKRNLGKEA